MPPGSPESYDQAVKRLMARAVALPPRTQDAALALALLVINVGTVLPYGSQMHPLWLALFLVIAQAVPLAWRRSYPLAVLIVAGIPRILYDQLAFGYAPIPLANTIAFYTAMVYCRPAVRRVVIVLTVIGSIQSQVAPGHTQPYDAFVSGLTTLAAWLAARAAGVDDVAVQIAFGSFNGLAHRMVLVRELDGVRYVNDSKGTNVDATLKSLEGLDDGRVILILGGKDKAGEFERMRELVRQKVRAVLTVGAAAERISSALTGAAEIVQAHDMAQAIAWAHRNARSGETVLLSPACASFDQYRNFEHRGDHFEELVRSL